MSVSLAPPTIAIVANTSWSIFNFRLGLIRRLRERGYEVLAIAPKDSCSARLIAEGIQFEHLEMSKYGSELFQEIGTIRRLVKIYKKYQPKFIFHYTIKPNLYGSIAAKICRIPSIAVATGLGRFGNMKGVKKFILKSLYKLAGKYSKELWVLNESDRDYFQDKGIVASDKLHILPGEGVNIMHFRPNDDYGMNKQMGHPTFIFAGRLVWSKGIKEYVQAAGILKKRYPDATFQILGFIDPQDPDSVPCDFLHKWQQRGIIQYLGDAHDVRPHLDEATCLVLPSYYGEGMSRILLEGASMSLPIITCDNVGCREIVQEGVNGLIVKPESTTDLAGRMEEFLFLPVNERYKMGLRGRKKVVQHFDEEIVIEHYLEAIKKHIGLLPVFNVDALLDKLVESE